MSESTMSLLDFIEGEKKDSNLFWRLPCGDHQNLLDDALDALAVAQKTVAFFASVIKSGEPWTPTCQNEFDKAMSSDTNQGGES